MTIFDASSLFNLQNGALIPTVLSLPDVRMAFGPQVRQECRSIGASLDLLVAEGSVELLADDDLPFVRFAELSAKYDLGPGETECLVFAESLSCSVCCDDRKARQMISAEIGENRLTGTIGLIHSAVVQGLMTEDQARAAHSTMIARGAFLPDLSLAVSVKDSVIQ